MPITNSFLPTGLEEYVRAVLNQYGFEKLPAQEQQTLLSKFVDHLTLRLSSAILPVLPSEGVEEFKELIMSSDSEKEWNAFWTTYATQVAPVIQKTLEESRKEIESIMQEA